MSTPATGPTCLIFLIKAWPSDVGDAIAIDPWDYGVRDIGEGGEETEGIEFVGSAGHVDEIDIAKAKGVVTDCLNAIG